MSVMGMMGKMGKMDMMGQTTRQLCYQQCTAGALWRKAAESLWSSYPTGQTPCGGSRARLHAIFCVQCTVQIHACTHVCICIIICTCGLCFSVCVCECACVYECVFVCAQHSAKQAQGSRYGGSDNTTTLLSTMHRGGALEESSRKFVVIIPSRVHRHEPCTPCPHESFSMRLRRLVARPSPRGMHPLLP